MAATTPEGKVKNRINKLLDSKGEFLYYYMPVPGGYGRSTLDYIGAYHGRAFGIEAKRPGKKPSPRQDVVIEDMQKAGMEVFVINDDEGLMRLSAWLDGAPHMKEARQRDSHGNH